MIKGALCISPEAYEHLLETVGRRPPETGAKGFGPWNRLGVDTFEFDEVGSSRASGGVYSPDTEWGSSRVDYWMNQPKGQTKVWTGDVHSHPGNISRPSGRHGEAMGDLAYADAVMAANEFMAEFYLPIITFPDRGQVEVTGWVLRRGHQNPDPVEIKVCEPSQWPERTFNPAWEAAQKAPAEPVLVTPASKKANSPAFQPGRLELSRLAALLGSGFDISVLVGKAQWELDVRARGFRIGLMIDADFPAAAPRLVLRSGADRERELVFGWQATSEKPPERRVAALLKWASESLRRPF